jgi:hypothetical protein
MPVIIRYLESSIVKAVLPASPAFVPLLLLLAALHTGAAAQSSSEPDLYGNWRGYAQFRAIEGDNAPVPHSPVAFSLSIDKAGKVAGSTIDNGCTLSGIALRDRAPATLYLDVTLSGCLYAGFNRRFAGSLAAHREKNAQLNLRPFTATPAAHFDIRAMMRR